MFQYHRLIQFYETDQMGIVHHSNYLRYIEEARVSWSHSKGLIDYQKPESASYFAVVETRVSHVSPARFGDQITIDLQCRREGNRILFQYRIHMKNGITVALVETTHVPVRDMKATKMPQHMRKILEGEVWTETWLSNS